MRAPSDPLIRPSDTCSPDSRRPPGVAAPGEKACDRRRTLRAEPCWFSLVRRETRLLIGFLEPGVLQVTGRTGTRHDCQEAGFRSSNIRDARAEGLGSTIRG